MFQPQESQDCPIVHNTNVLTSSEKEQVILWQNIMLLPEDCQHRIGQLFLGNKLWAQNVVSLHAARLQREREKRVELFWQERLVGFCGT